MPIHKVEPTKHTYTSGLNTISGRITTSPFTLQDLIDICTNHNVNPKNVSIMTVENISDIEGNTDSVHHVTIDTENEELILANWS